MKSIEQQLAEEKKIVQSVAAPEELESRLRNALNSAAPPKRKRIRPVCKIAAAAMVFMIFVGYNYNAFAYYGKKLIGYDEVIDGTLRELNDKGMGQVVDKRFALIDGTELIIDGIMSDANQLIMYYSLRNPNGVDDSAYKLFSPSQITGFLTKSHMESGMSVMNEEQTEIKGMFSFEPVNPFAKKLTLHFWQNMQNNREDTLSFAYHPDEAMQTEIKQSIGKTIHVDKGTITFHSITATPTMTLIKGSVNVANFDRVQAALYGIELIANGTPVDMMGTGSQSGFGGRTFELRYDTLPEKLESLDIVMKEFVGYQELGSKIPLASISDEPVQLLEGKALWIKKMSVTSNGVEITIASEDDVKLDGVSVEAGNVTTPLNTTVNQNEVKQPDGTLMKERTLLFDMTAEPDYLLIEGMHYMKAYNNMIEIPVD
ncbi:hypothetical protein D3C80_794450 [compost metagenome]